MSDLQVHSRAPLGVREIFDKHADFVWRVLARAGVRDADLRDATQDVFVVVANKLATRDESAAVTTWLFGISIRVAANHRRKAHHRREELTDEPPEGQRESNPELAAINSESRALLARVLEDLPEGQRLVFEMFELEEMTCQTIAERLGTPLGTIYTRLRAARAAFTKKARSLAVLR